MKSMRILLLQKDFPLWIDTVESARDKNDEAVEAHNTHCIRMESFLKQIDAEPNGLVQSVCSKREMLAGSVAAKRAQWMSFSSLDAKHEDLTMKVASSDADPAKTTTLRQQEYAVLETKLVIQRGERESVTSSNVAETATVEGKRAQAACLKKGEAKKQDMLYEHGDIEANDRRRRLCRAQQPSAADPSGSNVIAPALQGMKIGFEKVVAMIYETVWI